MRRTLVLLTCCGLATSSVLANEASTAWSAPGDSELTVTVIRDFDGDGSYTPSVEFPLAGIPVTLSDAAGTELTETTDASGDAVFDAAASGLTGSRYKVEASIPDEMSYLQPAPAGGSLSALVSFVDLSGGARPAPSIGTEPAPRT